MAVVGRYKYNGSNTEKVGSYVPNAWGLYDMHGNVAEWCFDYGGTNGGYIYDYKSIKVIDPRENESDRHRIIRGGSHAASAASCRSASRSYYDYEGMKSNYHGFRIVYLP